MAAGNLSYEGIHMQGNSRGHFGHNFSMVDASKVDCECEADWMLLQIAMKRRIFRVKR